MKKIIAFLMTLCMLVAVLCIAAVTVSAEGSADPIVMRVTATKKDGTVFTPEKSEFTSFSEGWVTAATYAKDSTWKNNNNIDRIIVDLLADWTAANTSFGSGEGFSEGAICIPKNTRFTLNMNGHTIDRDLNNWYYNGEVLYIREGADVIINGGKDGDEIVALGKAPGTAPMGTITGGNSGNGAGGIHIDGKANVTLNNVHVVGNVADDDNGAGIAIHDNATLNMNGGSISNNISDGKSQDTDKFDGGGIYVYKANANFNNVEFKNNQNTKNSTNGTAIFATGSEVTIEQCLFDGNGIHDSEKGTFYAISVIYANDSNITVRNSTFTNNSSARFTNHLYPLLEITVKEKYASLFYLKNSTFTMENDCKITNNDVYDIFYLSGNVGFYVSDTTITDNTGVVLNTKSTTDDSYFKNCTFNNNISPDPERYDHKKDFDFSIRDNALTFYGCDLGDSIILDDNKSKRIVFADLEDFDNPDALNASDYVSSIFGEGSLTMILVIISLVASSLSIFLTVFYNKKKTVPQKATDGTATDTEE